MEQSVDADVSSMTLGRQPALSAKREDFTMSASDTNIDKQTKRHKPSLVGIGAAVALAVLAGVIYVFGGFGTDEDQATSSEPAATQAVTE
jgi:hypothetical protein